MVYQLASPIRDVAEGLKAIARSLEKRGTTYNVIVNVPVGADPDEIQRKVVTAIEHSNRAKSAVGLSSKYPH